ncbi:hypothetical protein [Salinibacter sp.]|uniref:hypothetical protein n=1 Tax=Salinibacter sp. TaxID=2065818 RepID=UPI0021E809B2|nr:hypothetical protein [Salinibacter sp.]
MEDSLLVSLRSYQPRPDRDPLEDFVTEAFAWTLRAHPPIGSQFLSEIDRRADLPKGSVGEDGWEWDTQVDVGEGRADMLAIGDHRTYVFEHKVGQTAKAKQVDRYRRSLTADEVVTVLIMDAKWNYEGPQSADVEDPDLRLTWAEVSKILGDKSDELETADRIDDFRALLDHEGLGPRKPLGEPDLRAVPRYKETIDHLTKLMKEVRLQKEEWESVYDLLDDPSGQSQPKKRWSGTPPRYGRIALRLYQDYNPNINFGLIIDPENIRTTLVDRNLGPDLAVFLHVPYGALPRGQYNELVNSQAYEDLRKRLAENSRAEWTAFAPKGTDPGINKHHPLVLQRPLAHVLRGTQSVEDQRAEVLDALKEGVELFLKGREMEKLREKMLRYREENQ